MCTMHMKRGCATTLGCSLHRSSGASKTLWSHFLPLPFPLPLFLEPLLPPPLLPPLLGLPVGEGGGGKGGEGRDVTSGLGVSAGPVVTAAVVAGVGAEPSVAGVGWMQVLLW